MARPKKPHKLTEEEKHHLKGIRQEKMRVREAAFFLVYYEMGVGRSLMALSKRLGELGVKISAKSLERYSSTFDWQQRIIERDTAEIERQKADQALIVDRMNLRQADLGGAFQSLAAGGIRHLLDKLKPDLTTGKIEPEKLDPVTAAYLAKTGMRMERLARGEVTERKEAIIHVHNQWILHVAAIFRSVNELADPEQRADEFTFRMQSFIDDQVKQLGMGEP